MIEQLKTFDTNTLAFEIIDGFTEADTEYAQKLFNQKLAMGFDTVNILVKVDEYKVSNTETKAFFEDIIFALRHIKNMGHIAIVAHSKILKVLVPIDNLFFERAGKGKKEQYFDVSQMSEAYEFVS